LINKDANYFLLLNQSSLKMFDFASEENILSDQLFIFLLVFLHFLLEQFDFSIIRGLQLFELVCDLLSGEVDFFQFSVIDVFVGFEVVQLRPELGVEGL